MSTGPNVIALFCLHRYPCLSSPGLRPHPWRFPGQGPETLRRPYAPARGHVTVSRFVCEAVGQPVQILRGRRRSRAVAQRHGLRQLALRDSVLHREARARLARRLRLRFCFAAGADRDVYATSYLAETGPVRHPSSWRADEVQRPLVLPAGIPSPCCTSMRRHGGR